MSIIIQKHIVGDYDIDETVNWAIDHCPSFDKYMLVELGWEEKMATGSWFRLDVYFDNDKDAMMFSLRWL